MRITTDHPASSYGIPVILDDDGGLLDHAPGIKAVRKRLGLSTTELGELVGKSRSAIEKYEAEDRSIPANVLVMMGKLLEDDQSR